MDNLDFYNKFKAVPEEAKRTIKGGRLSGFTDINPMWRIKVLTETFGPVGIGWYYEIKRSWTEPAAKNEIAVFVEVHLFFKHENEWSKPLVGVGGNTLVDVEAKGPRTNDECFKMALTDALSVACKVLGIGADVYYEKDRSKYDVSNEQQPNEQEFTDSKKTSVGEKPLSEPQCKRYYAIAKTAGFEKKDAEGLVLKRFGKEAVSTLTRKEYDAVCKALEETPDAIMEWYKKKAS